MLFYLLQVLCDGEAFMEDVILVGLDMLPMDLDLQLYKSSGEGCVRILRLYIIEIFSTSNPIPD